MFSIAAINDTDSRGKWEPLAPTKEVQEFHLSQAYHEGLLKLQSKEYGKAQELLESVLKDPMISNAQVDSSASDCHLLQLRFLALKNLANVFLQQGSAYYESALRCYLQAVEIDAKDSVVWNQLGTLACSMGSLSISRWAFEQGLLCSPNNWNCMEKLLEVLIAIGDEVACLSVANLILRHWPSHSRAVIVKTTIEDSEAAPFAPRGIDKLEPKHVRLKFLDKRKATSENLDEGIARKTQNQNIQLYLAEASWVALADALLKILLPLSENCSKTAAESACRSGDVRLAISIPSGSENINGSSEKKKDMNICGSMPLDGCNAEERSIVKEKEANNFEEQPLERRSTRLERRRSRKPGKEEVDFSTDKDLAKPVVQFLESFIIDGLGIDDCDNAASRAMSYSAQANSLDTECNDISIFLRDTSKNYGAYHMVHLLLEHTASRSLMCHDAFLKILELEKLTRNWGQERTPKCSLFLAELYYDLGQNPSIVPKHSEFVSEASYHLCKIIESVSLNYQSHQSSSPLNPSSFSNFEASNGTFSSDLIHQDSSLDSSFWVRFFWLSAQLSILDGDKSKAYEQLCISLSLLMKREDMNGPLRLPHCKIIKELSIDRILHEINLLQTDYLLDRTLGELMEKGMHLECVARLSPLLFSTKNVHLDLLPLPAAGKFEGFTSTELSALDILISACEKTKPVDIEVYLNSHWRKLQILMAVCGMDGSLAFSKSSHQKFGSKMYLDNTSSRWSHLVADEVKAILQCVSQVKISMDKSDSSGIIVPVSSICGIQSLLLVVMCNVASNFHQTDQKQQCCLVDAATAFCKLQYLNLAIPIKTQVELLVAVHDLLAEYGLCCGGENGQGEEGTFLKFAIKHLLALNIKVKSNFSPSEKKTAEYDNQSSHDSPVKTSQGEAQSDAADEVIHMAIIDETIALKKDDAEVIVSNATSSHSGLEKDYAKCESRCVEDDKMTKGEKVNSQVIDCGNVLAEDEKEELELMIDNALEQCFFCLYGLNLRSDSSYEDDIVAHKNTSRGDYQTKEQCADVFQYILPYAKASTRTGLVKLRRVLRSIRKHFPQPPADVLAGNVIDKYLDDPDICEDKLSEDAGTDGYLETIMKIIFPDMTSLNQYKMPSVRSSSEPYWDIYSNLYYFLAQSEEMSTTDKWPGFVLTKEGEEFVQQNANLFKFDLLYNPLRFESWQRLANIYDEEVDLLLNDGSKHINGAGWRRNDVLPQRVERSRRRSRRCLLMSLGLAKTSAQQAEIHELLALVYYDGLQNVVPFYDQRSIVPLRDVTWRMFCESALKHFKKAFLHKEDWSYAFYMGKLCEKLGYSCDISLSYYDKAISLNPSAVDALYRMHASRLKLLSSCGKTDLEALKVLSLYSFSLSIKDGVMNIFNTMDPQISHLPEVINNENPQLNPAERKHKELVILEEAWHMLYSDCLSALQVCVEGDLKHFHKARYMLAQGLYRRGESGDLMKAKDELSFCFKSSRSSFTINMWEIDSMVKKGRRKMAGNTGNKKVLEVNLPESSRKFITCIRKYLLFYLKLLEETGEICTLERSYVSLRADKRFSLCLEDLVPVALGRYIRALLTSMPSADADSATTSQHQLDKIFSLFLEQGNLWPEICRAPEIRSPEISENGLYGYLHQYLVSLERKGKLEILEAINEKIRKRFKNPKLSNSNCAKVCRHASVAWCRTLIVNLALITPLPSSLTDEIQVINPTDAGSENRQLLCVDLQTNDLWSLFLEDKNDQKVLETKWNPYLTKIKNIIVKKALDENVDNSNLLLRSSYNFYRESSCVTLPSGVGLYLVPDQLAKETQFRPGIDGVEILDVSIPRKLLLWAYTLSTGRYANISAVVKHCEENVKSKMKKGTSTPSTPPRTSIHTVITTHTGGGKDGSGSQVGGTQTEESPTTLMASAPVSMSDCSHYVLALPSSAENQKSTWSTAQQPHQGGYTVTERSIVVYKAADNQENKS